MRPQLKPSTLAKFRSFLWYQTILIFILSEEFYLCPYNSRYFFFPWKMHLGISKNGLYILNASHQLLGMKEFVVRSVRILVLIEEVNLITAQIMFLTSESWFLADKIHGVRRPHMTTRSVLVSYETVESYFRKKASPPFTLSPCSRLYRHRWWYRLILQETVRVVVARE